MCRRALREPNNQRPAPFFRSRVLSHKYSQFAHVVEEEFMRQCNSGIPSVLSCFVPKSDLELSSTRGCQLSWRFRGQALASCSDHNAFHPRKGKPAERRRRKATDRWGHRPPWWLRCRRDGQVKSPSVPRLTAFRRRPKSFPTRASRATG